MSLYFLYFLFVCFLRVSSQLHLNSKLHRKYRQIKKRNSIEKSQRGGWGVLSDTFFFLQNIMNFYTDDKRLKPTRDEDYIASLHWKAVGKELIYISSNNVKLNTVSIIARSREHSNTLDICMDTILCLMDSIMAWAVTLITLYRSRAVSSGHSFIFTSND